MGAIITVGTRLCGNCKCHVWRQDDCLHGARELCECDDSREMRDKVEVDSGGERDEK